MDVVMNQQQADAINKELAARDQRIAELKADNTRLREALDKISNKAKCVCMLEVGRVVGDCETCKIADEALAPQPAKEGEDALLARLEGDDENTK